MEQLVDEDILLGSCLEVYKPLPMETFWAIGNQAIEN